MRYTTYQIPKANGVRQITAPSRRLKYRQRKILRELENKFEVSRLCHGFVAGRSPKTNAEKHLGKKYILNIDIKNFFPNCTYEKLERAFIAEREYSITPAKAGKEEMLTYWQKIAPYVLYNPSRPQNPVRIIKGVLDSIGHGYYRRLPYALPQGAPTSPFLANLVLSSFDRKLVGVLRKHYSDDIVYTRYADDITISSNSKGVFWNKTHKDKLVRPSWWRSEDDTIQANNKFTSIPNSCRQVYIVVEKSLLAEGFTINKSKTRLMVAGTRQEVTGLNLNSGKATIPRKYRKRIRSIIHRAHIDGWIMSREQYDQVAGMVGHISLCHPKEGKKLLAELNHVHIPESAPQRLVGKRNIKTKERYKQVVESVKADTGQAQLSQLEDGAIRRVFVPTN